LQEIILDQSSHFQCNLICFGQRTLYI
jgi:hypothetical protein